MRQRVCFTRCAAIATMNSTASIYLKLLQRVLFLFLRTIRFRLWKMASFGFIVVVSSVTYIVHVCTNDNGTSAFADFSPCILLQESATICA